MNHTQQTMDMDHGHSMGMDHGEMNHTMSMDHMGMHMMMRMFFHFSKNVPTFLFESWSVQTNEELVGAIVFSFVLAVLFEGLKTLRDMVSKKTKRFLYQPHQECSNMADEIRSPIRHRHIKLWLMRVVLSVLRTLDIGIAYILMLIAMTYNVWLFLSVCVGAGFGFFIFLIIRPSKAITNDHCG